MATVIRYINTNSAAGGTGVNDSTVGENRAYSSMSEWEAAEQTDLVTDGDIHIVNCDGEGGNDSTSDGVGVAGWTTGASNTLTIQQNSSGTNYKLTASADSVLRPAEDYVTIDGIECETTNSGSEVINLAFGFYTSADNNVIIKNCILHGNDTSSSQYAIGASVLNLVIDVFNCAVWSGTRSTDTRQAATANISYSTFFRHADQLGLICSKEATVKNTYSGKASGSQEDFWTGGDSPSGSNNASSDTSASTDYTKTVTSAAPGDQFTNITSGSEDFSLKSGAGLDGAGTTIAGITTDIEGTARDISTPDIGAYELAGGVLAAVTGTATASITETDVVTGGKTTIITLTGDTWVASGTTFDAQRQNIIDGCTSAQSELTGWNNEVRDNEATTSVVRTSDTVVTITWSAAASYDITAQETITVTVPATALVTSGTAVVATPTFTVDAVAGVSVVPPALHGLDNQFSQITANRLNGVLQ